MTDETTQVAGNAAPTPESFDSAESAAAFMLDREKKSPAESAEQATAEPELAVEANAAPAEEQATGEMEEEDPAETPPLPLPRSWTKEQAEHWTALPRATQEYLTAQDSKASAEVRRVQNEAAEKLKGLTAKEQQADEARQKYEAKLPEIMQGLTDHNNRQFADIKSMADLETLANEALRLSATDPVAAGQIQAYLQAWNVHQQKMAATKAEIDQANHRKTTKEQTDWQDFMAQENAKARELIPELADPVKGPLLEKRAAAHLTEKLGFTQDDLNAMAAGKQRIGIYHHAFQVLLDRSLKLEDLQQAKATIPAKVAPKTLPPVQRPGVSRPASAGNSERIQALESKLNNSGSEEDAFALLMARRNAAARRAS